MTDKQKRKLKESGFVYGLLAWPMLMWVLGYVFVNANSILLAFQRIDANFNYHWNGVENFKSVIKNFTTDGALLRIAMLNNIEIFFWTLIIGFPLNMLFGYYLYKKKLGHQAVRFIVMTPSLLSGMVVSLLFLKFCETALPEIVYDITHKQIGNILRKEGTAMPMIVFYTLWTGFTTSLIYYPNAMNAIDNSVIESAMLDGANTLQELIYIIVPLIHPTIVTLIVSNLPAIFTNSGPLFAFFYRDAPTHIWTMGYYVFTQTLYGEGVQGYPYMAALGLVLSLMTFPVVYFGKWFLEATDPMRDTEKTRRKVKVKGGI